MGNNYSDFHKKVIQQVTDAMEYYMKSIDGIRDHKGKNDISKDFVFPLSNKDFALIFCSCDPEAGYDFFISTVRKQDANEEQNVHTIKFNLEEFTNLARSIVGFLNKNGINYGKE